MREGKEGGGVVVERTVAYDCFTDIITVIYLGPIPKALCIMLIIFTWNCAFSHFISITKHKQFYFVCVRVGLSTLEL